MDTPAQAEESKSKPAVNRPSQTMIIHTINRHISQGGNTQISQANRSAAHNLNFKNERRARQNRAGGTGGEQQESPGETARKRSVEKADKERAGQGAQSKQGKDGAPKNAMEKVALQKQKSAKRNPVEAFDMGDCGTPAEY